MVIPCIGASLTAGTLGIPYLSSVALPPETKVVNRGRDGDTVAGVRDRLDPALRTDGASVLVIQVGANDILLPEMEERGGGWTSFVKEMIAGGSVPTSNTDEFEAIYEELIATAGAWGITRVVGVPIPPLGENLHTERNRRREEFNNRIRRATNRSDGVLADAAAEFETALGDLPALSDFFFTRPQDFVIDLRRLHRDKGAKILAEERGLRLTMDGAHLNESGAALMARTVSAALRRT